MKTARYRVNLRRERDIERLPSPGYSLALGITPGEDMMASNAPRSRISGDSVDSGVFVEEAKRIMGNYIVAEALKNDDDAQITLEKSAAEQTSLPKELSAGSDACPGAAPEKGCSSSDIVLVENRTSTRLETGTETQALMGNETQAVEGNGMLLVPVETEARRLQRSRNEERAISPKPGILRSATMQAAQATSPEVILQEARKCQTNGLWQGSIQLLSLSKVLEDPVFGGHAVHMMAEAYYEIEEHEKAWEFGLDALEVLEQCSNEKQPESMKQLYDCTALMARVAWVLGKGDEAKAYRTSTIDGYKSILAIEQRKRDEENRRRKEAFSKVTDLVKSFGLYQGEGLRAQDDTYIQLDGDNEKILKVFAMSVRARNYELTDAMMLDKSILSRRRKTKFDDIHWYDRSRPAPLSGTALYYTIENNSLRSLAVLLAMGADVNDSKGIMPPLSAAIHFQREDLALFLLENGADPNGTPNKAAKKPLDCALALKNVKLAELLLQDGNGTDANEIIVRSITTNLEYIMSFENGLEMVSLLLKHGADPNLPDILSHRTPLYSAVMHKQTEMAKLLLSHGAAPSMPCKTLREGGTAGNTPLHAAAANNDTAMAKMLCETGADLNRRNAHQETPFFMAVQLGNVDFATVLCKNGADIKLANGRGETPLHIATATARIKTVTMLCQEGADVNAVREVYKETPLHIAAREGYLEISAVLCSYDANVNARADHDWTPLHKATWYGNSEVVDRLCKEGADVNARTDSQETALDLAKQKGYSHFDILKLLYKNGGRYSTTWRLRRNYGELSKAIKERK